MLGSFGERSPFKKNPMKSSDGVGFFVCLTLTYLRHPSQCFLMYLCLNIAVSKKILIVSGILLFFISQIIFGLLFYPVISLEIDYHTKKLVGGKTVENNRVLPEKEGFKIMIPKIDVRSEVLPGINPFDKNEYIPALKKGVAQAKGTALPGEEGNIFIFAHSTDNPLNVSHYNAIFYLINKLVAGDKIYLVYQGKYYRYVVESTKIVGAKEINYLKTQEKRRTLTLMTCWPAGTTLKRLLVTGVFTI